MFRSRVSVRRAAHLLALTLVGCTASTTPPSSQAPPPKTAEPAPRAATRSTLSLLTRRETALVEELSRDVAKLATEIGDRSSGEPWNQASVTDYVVEQFEAAGYAVDRQGYSLEGEETAQNLQVQVPGGVFGYEIVVVGAHYDSVAGSPGANDNASGVAALLALARSLSHKKPTRTLRFVAFANQEEPYFKTALMGSQVYAKRAVGAGEKIVGAVCIESIGYFTDEPNSQQRPGALQLRFPDKGNFVAVVGNEASAELADQLTTAISDRTSLPVRGGGLPADLAEMGGADHWAFWQMQLPAVVVTDTGPLRDPFHHQAGDTAGRLDFERMARVVAALERSVLELASPAAPEIPVPD